MPGQFLTHDDAPKQHRHKRALEDKESRRWVIEQLFRTMKTRGFDIKAVPVRHDRSLWNLACATLIAAIQIQQMMHDRDGQACRPMTDVFEAADQPSIAATCSR